MLRLLPHQEALVNEWGGHLRPLLVGGAVGSGKTAAVLMLDQARRKTRPSIYPTMIVVPAGVLFQWGEAIREWVGQEPVLVHGNRKEREAILEHIESRSLYNTETSGIHYVVAGYDTVRIHWRWFQSQYWYQIIADEAHILKGSANITTHAAKAMDALSRIGLTGTPIRNRPGDLWSLLHFLEPGGAYTWNRERTRIPVGMRMRWANPAWGSYDFFKERYLDKNGMGRNLGELHQRLGEIMVRWKKEEVLPYLPELRKPQVIRLPLAPPQRQLYDAMRQEFMASQAGPKQLRKYAAMAQLSTFRRVAAMSPKALGRGPSDLSAKAQWVRDYLTYQSEENESILVLTNWVEAAQELGRMLADFNPVVVTGKTGLGDRKEAVDHFGKVFIGSPAAFEGLNLQKASVVVWIDLPWNSTDVVQGTGRVHRIGQTKDVDVYYLLAENTVDTKVFQLTRRKAEDIAQAIDGGLSAELLQFPIEQLI